MIEKKIICMHGGIGRSINSVEQIEKIERPITMDVGSIILMDLLWYLLAMSSLFAILFFTLEHILISEYTFYLYKCRSDPTENDSVEGLRPNARGPGLVTFGV
jgi:protein phosphatase